MQLPYRGYLCQIYIADRSRSRPGSGSDVSATNFSYGKISRQENGFLPLEEGKRETLAVAKNIFCRQ